MTDAALLQVPLQRTAAGGAGVVARSQRHLRTRVARRGFHSHCDDEVHYLNTRRSSPSFWRLSARSGQGPGAAGRGTREPRRDQAGEPGSRMRRQGSRHHRSLPGRLTQSHFSHVGLPSRAWRPDQTQKRSVSRCCTLRTLWRMLISLLGRRYLGWSTKPPVESAPLLAHHRPVCVLETGA